MYLGKKIGVTVPAHNEEQFVGNVVDTMPAFVDRIYVVDDASSDRTGEIILDRASRDARVALITRNARGGVGAAVLTGHAVALREGMEIIAVMAGDGQMDPAVLESIIRPVAEEAADYVKGNRLSSRQLRKEMPPWRQLGNFLLTWLTRLASGYWEISDPQDGFTAISAGMLRKLDLQRVETGFAFENDMLVRLKVAGARVKDVPHPALYRGQNSKIRYASFISRTSWVLFKDFVWRIKQRRGSTTTAASSEHRELSSQVEQRR